MLLLNINQTSNTKPYYTHSVEDPTYTIGFNSIQT